MMKITVMTMVFISITEDASITAENVPRGFITSIYSLTELGGAINTVVLIVMSLSLW